MPLTNHPVVGFLVTLLKGALLIVLLVCGLWVVGAIWYDAPIPGKPFWAGLLGLVYLGVLIFVRSFWRKALGALLLFGLVLGWWLTLKPSNDRNWQGDVAKEPSALVEGDVVTIRNVRNFEYRTDTDYTPHWETRSVRLSQITGIDMAINYWGSPWMAHPIISFQFADAPPLCFSIETRKEVGESYSAIGGFFRQYELIYVASDERDVIRVRTNYRRGEEVFFYRTRTTPAQARERFMDYVKTLNQMHAQPRWYNAVTTNCTTSIRTQHAASERPPWDWRMLLNGKGDEMIYERNGFVTDGLPFAELKARALINPAAKAANDDPDFSKAIRAGRPGF